MKEKLKPEQVFTLEDAIKASEQINELVKRLLQQEAEQTLPQEIVVERNKDGRIVMRRWILGTPGDAFSSRDSVSIELSPVDKKGSLEVRVYRNIHMNSVIKYGQKRKVERVQRIAITLGPPKNNLMKVFGRLGQRTFDIQGSDDETQYIPNYYPSTDRRKIDSAEKLNTLLAEILDQFSNPKPYYDEPHHV